MSDFTSQILPRSNTASVVVSRTESRLYIQNNEGEIFESIYRDGKRLNTTSTGLVAKRRTPLAALSFDGNEIRLYYLNDDNLIKEWAFSGNKGWYAGGLNSREPLADSTQINAIYWDRPSGRELVVYFQEENTTNIREIRHVLGQESATESVVKLPV